MANKYFFKVAGLPFAVVIPEHFSIDSLLPSFRPFRCTACAEEQLAFSLHATTQPFAAAATATELIGRSDSDMGHVCLWRTSGGYRVDIGCGTPGNSLHTTAASPDFACTTARLQPGCPGMGRALASMLRIAYAQAVLAHGGVSIHASCVNVKGSAYLFLGKSGTGKSTHARMWMKASPYCSLLNDDNPVLRIEQGRVMAYGTPWSGKTPCYKNECCPVAGIARLQQAPANRFTPLAETETFAALLPSCSAIRHDARLHDALCRTLIYISEHVPVGRLECRPDTDAAWMCFEGLNDIKQ